MSLKLLALALLLSANALQSLSLPFKSLLYKTMGGMAVLYTATHLVEYKLEAIINRMFLASRARQARKKYYNQNLPEEFVQRFEYLLFCLEQDLSPQSLKLTYDKLKLLHDFAWQSYASSSEKFLEQALERIQAWLPEATYVQLYAAWQHGVAVPVCFTYKQNEWVAEFYIAQVLQDLNLPHTVADCACIDRYSLFGLIAEDSIILDLFSQALLQSGSVHAAFALTRFEHLCKKLQPSFLKMLQHQACEPCWLQQELSLTGSVFLMTCNQDNNVLSNSCCMIRALEGQLSDKVMCSTELQSRLLHYFASLYKKNFASELLEANKTQVFRTWQSSGLKLNKFFEKLFAVWSKETSVDELQQVLQKIQPIVFTNEQKLACLNSITSMEEWQRLDLRPFNLPPQVLQVAQQDQVSLEHDRNNSAVYMQHLKLLLQLPWQVHPRCSDFSLEQAKQVLDKGFYGLARVKQEVLGYLALQQVRFVPEGQVLCVVGPPGVGKTSIAKAIAQAIGQEFVSTSMLGMSSGAQLLGLPHSYQCSTPGLLLSGMSKCSSTNPVFLLDEVDKIDDGTTQCSYLINSLLCVLDKTQNNSAYDAFLGFGYDYSKVFFVLTANDKNKIPDALLDRCHVIEISGYSVQEKVEIVTNHVLPKLNSTVPGKLGLNLTTQQIVNLCEEDKELGLRSLERQFQKMLQHRIAEVHKCYSYPR